MNKQPCIIACRIHRDLRHRIFRSEKPAAMLAIFYILIGFQTNRHFADQNTSIQNHQIKEAAEVMKWFFAKKEAIAIKREDGETERFGMKCTVRKQAIKSNEVIETTRASEQTNQVALNREVADLSE